MSNELKTTVLSPQKASLKSKRGYEAEQNGEAPRAKFTILLQTGLSRNNQGAFLIRESCLDEAIEKLTQSLKIIKKAMHMFNEWNLHEPIVGQTEQSHSYRNPSQQDYIVVGTSRSLKSGGDPYELDSRAKTTLSPSVATKRTINTQDPQGVQNQETGCHDDEDDQCRKDERDDAEQTSSCFVFSAPLVFEWEHNRLNEIKGKDDNTMKRCLSNAGKAIMFNLALAYHLATIKRKRSTLQQGQTCFITKKSKLNNLRTIQTKAMSMYRLCWTSSNDQDGDFEIYLPNIVDDSSSSSFSSSASSRVLLFNLVVLNNLSQMSSFVGNHTMALQYKQVLLSNLLLLSQELKTRDMDASILQHFFDATMMSLIFGNFSAASAA